jgi:mono/diheme cytochrome c family protein
VQEVLAVLERTGQGEMADAAGWWRDHLEDRELIVLPDAEPKPPLPPAPEILALAGTEARGEKLFRGRATCGTCHRFDGAGGAIGPDLGHSLRGRSAGDVLTMMLSPTAGIMPSARSLRLSAGDLADLIAYLEVD